jgi:hypothetical protein
MPYDLYYIGFGTYAEAFKEQSGSNYQLSAFSSRPKITVNLKRRPATAPNGYVFPREFVSK